MSELIQYLESFTPPDDKHLLNQVIKQHHLQAFNPKYFGVETEPTSYSLDNLHAAKTVLKTDLRTPDTLRTGFTLGQNRNRTIDLIFRQSMQISVAE